MSVLFYGGQGGGKKQKSTVLELGHLISLELIRSRSTDGLQKAKEWQAKWTHHHIRDRHQAFYLMCFYCEVMLKLAADEEVHDDNQQYDEVHQGLFKVLSNGIFYLDKRCQKEHFSVTSEMVTFLGKLLIDMGVFPIREHCIFCEIDLMEMKNLYLLSDQGGFSCSDCYKKAENERVSMDIERDGRELWELLGIIATHRFENLGDLECSGMRIAEQIFSFFAYQFQFKKADFKTLGLIL